MTTIATVQSALPVDLSMASNQNIFQDRRAADRRQAEQPERIPPSGCRRSNDRRARGRRFDPRPWWLKARYVDGSDHG